MALATDAVRRGADLRLAHRVDAIATADGITTLQTSGGEIRARWVVNAAGLGSDVIDRMYGFDRFTVTPRRGELLVFDKLARPLADRIVLPVPSTLGKGVLVSPTIYGNLMLGPTAQDLDDRTATETSPAGFAFLVEKGKRLMPRLLEEEVTASYAGLRAAIDRSDYLIDVSPPPLRYVLVGGIRSTGLSSAMGIAEHVTGLLGAAGLAMTERDAVPEPPRMPNIGEAFLRPYADAERIAADPEYGRIVCFCERVTAGEIRDAFASHIAPRTLAGLRRRTRVMNGRCQGFYCGAAVGELMAAGRERSAAP